MSVFHGLGTPLAPQTRRVSQRLLLGIFWRQECLSMSFRDEHPAIGSTCICLASKIATALERFASLSRALPLPWEKSAPRVCRVAEFVELRQPHFVNVAQQPTHPTRIHKYYKQTFQVLLGFKPRASFLSPVPPTPNPTPDSQKRTPSPKP